MSNKALFLIIISLCLLALSPLAAQVSTPLPNRVAREKGIDSTSIPPSDRGLTPKPRTDRQGGESVGGESVESTTYPWLVRQGITAMEDDSLMLAERLFKLAMREAPSAHTNAILWSHLASIHERTGREQEALEDYKQALAIAPGTTGILLSRASLYLKLGNEDRALTDYDEVLQQQPEHQEALLMRAYIKQRKRLLKEARADYEHLLRLQPTHEQALLGLALVNNEGRRPQEAMETINRAIDLYPTHAAGYALRAGMEFERKLYELAELDYGMAIDLDPTNVSYRLARASFYTKTKRKRLAREDVREAARLGASPAEVAGAAGYKIK